MNWLLVGVVFGMTTLNPPPVVYVAGPFAAPDAAGIRQNVLNACALSLYAVTEGLSPLCPHPGIMAGAFGRESSPAERERGIRMVLAHVELVARHSEGRFWAIQNPDGGLSSGTQRELECFVETWQALHPQDPYASNTIVVKTWAEWKATIPDSLIVQAGE